MGIQGAYPHDTGAPVGGLLTAQLHRMDIIVGRGALPPMDSRGGNGDGNEERVTPPKLVLCSSVRCFALLLVGVLGLLGCFRVVGLWVGVAGSFSGGQGSWVCRSLSLSLPFPLFRNKLV